MWSGRTSRLHCITRFRTWPGTLQPAPFPKCSASTSSPRSDAADIESVSAVGEAAVFTDTDVIVVRYRDCQGVLLRLVETPTRFWLDFSGLSFLEISRED
ncbi:DUF6510 family protein [Pseudarthrobacter sp. NPDC080039]|uniref:DUF6510 family protein n=1 Tax=unclassified Pseudarthrobacter TaxID=2647000 RepID=UPI0034502C09